MKQKYYVIANVDKEVPPLPHSHHWLKLVAFSFESMKILIVIGRGHGLMGGAIKIDEFRIVDWFKDWLINGVYTAVNAESNLKNILSSKCGVKTIDY